MESAINGLPVTLQPHTGMVLEATSFDAWFQAEFTPSGTSGTLNADTLAVTGCVADLIQNNIGGTGGTLPSFATAVAITARRKPGTSGALVDQQIIFTINSVEVARIEVDGSEEHFGAHVTSHPPAKGDPLYDIHTHNTISWTCTAADSDLQICVFIGGYNA